MAELSSNSTYPGEGGRGGVRLVEKFGLLSTKVIVLAGSLLILLFCGMAYAISPVLAVVLSVGIILLIFGLLRPKLLMLLALLAIPFDRMAAIDYLTVGKVLIGFIIVSLVVRALIRKDIAIIEDLFNSTTNLFLFLYLAISLVSVIKVHDFNWFFNVIISRISVAILLFLILHLISSIKLIEAALLLLIIGSFFVCLFGAYEVLTGQPILEQTFKGEELFFTIEGSHRIQGVSGNPDFHAMILVIYTGLLLALFVKSKSITLRIAFSGMILFYMMNIIATGSRGGLLGFLCVVVAFFIFHKSTKKWFVLGIVLTSLVLVFVFVATFSNVASVERYTGKSGGQSIVYRYGWILMSLEMVKKNPIIGVGTGNYVSLYNRYRRVAPDITPAEPFVQHNGLMQVWAENGTLGLIVFLVLLLSILAKGFLTVARAIDSRIRVVAVGIFAAYIGYLSCLMVFPALENENGWLAMGLLLATSNLNDRMLKEQVQVTHID